MSAEVAIDARTLTDRIKVAVEGAWQLVIEAYQSRAWSTLGYASWDEYCTREFGTSRLKLPREDRRVELVSMRESGMSLRAIETATGVSKTTIIKDLREVVQSAPPAPLSDEPGAVTKLTGSDSAAEVMANPITGEVLDGVPTVTETTETFKTKVTTGLDGKPYPKPEPKADRRRSIVDDAYKASRELWKAVERVRAIRADDRFARNKADILAALQPTVDLALEVFTDL